MKKDPPSELLQQARALDAANSSREDKQKDTKESRGNDTPPVTFWGTVVQKFAKSQQYNLDKNLFSFISDGYNSMISFSCFLAGFTPYVWSFCRTLTSSTLSPMLIGSSTENEFLISTAFSLILSLWDTLIRLPIAYYNTFFLEERHGFNKTTQWTFWTDAVKGFFIGNIISIPLNLAIVKLVRWGGSLFYFYVWLLMVAFSMLMLTIYPNFIMPLFNKYTPLEDSSLKAKINNLAESLKFPLTRIYEVDGSRRSSHSNAFLYGFFWDKRIVLYDTLFKKPEKSSAESEEEESSEATRKEEEELDLTCTDEEVVGILAHELGHWKLSHTFQGFLLQHVISLVTLRMFSEFVNNVDLYRDFGFVPLEGGDLPVIVGLSLFFQLMSPLGDVLGLAMNSLTRKFEYEADAFAVSLGKVNDLKTGLFKISISNLSSFDVDWLYHMFSHSHPTLLQRLQRMGEEEEKRQNQAKKNM